MVERHTVGVMDWSDFRSLLLTTDIDAAAGAVRSGTVDLGGQSATVSVVGVGCVLNEKIADLAEEEF